MPLTIIPKHDNFQLMNLDCETLTNKVLLVLDHTSYTDDTLNSKSLLQASTVNMSDLLENYPTCIMKTTVGHNTDSVANLRIGINPQFLTFKVPPNHKLVISDECNKKYFGKKDEVSIEAGIFSLFAFIPSYGTTSHDICALESSKRREPCDECSHRVLCDMGLVTCGVLVHIASTIEVSKSKSQFRVVNKKHEDSVMASIYHDCKYVIDNYSGIKWGYFTKLRIIESIKKNMLYIHFCKENGEYLADLRHTQLNGNIPIINLIRKISIGNSTMYTPGQVRHSLEAITEAKLTKNKKQVCLISCPVKDAQTETNSSNLHYLSIEGKDYSCSLVPPFAGVPYYVLPAYLLPVYADSRMFEYGIQEIFKG